jgi:hypothetical protein
MCIVMGRLRNEMQSKETHIFEDDRYYVLFIAAKEGRIDVYERVGVGYMPERFIKFHGSGIPVKVY